MSDVISFRLRKDNPRDAQALAVLQERLSQGYSTRYILTEALLQLREIGEHENTYLCYQEIIQNLMQLNDILVTMANGQIVQMTEKVESNRELSQTFLNSIKKSVNTGITIGSKMYPDQ
jgi:hypothetical protein